MKWDLSLERINNTVIIKSLGMCSTLMAKYYIHSIMTNRNSNVVVIEHIIERWTIADPAVSIKSKKQCVP